MVPAKSEYEEIDRQDQSTRDVNDMWYYFLSADFLEEGDTTPSNRISISRHPNNSNIRHRRKVLY